MTQNMLGLVKMTISYQAKILNIIYLLQGAGLVAASFIAIVPGYISRSVAGSYDNEGIAIFCMLLTYYLWIKSVKTGQIYWAALCSIAYFYMVGALIIKSYKHYIRFDQKYFMQSFFQVSSWGGYVFLINLIPLHVFTLMICGRYSHKVYVAYSTVYSLGTILSMQISFVGFQPVQTSEHMMVRIFQSTASNQFKGLSHLLPICNIYLKILFLVPWSVWIMPDSQFY